MSRFKKPTAEMKAMLARAGSDEVAVAMAAQHELAKALTLPLRQGVLKGDIIGGIYSPIDFAPGIAPEFPLDIIAPGTEAQYIAYTVPNTGKLPDKHVEGDYVMVPTFDVGATIDCALKYLRDARWDVMTRMMEVLEAMFTRKANNDGWRTILAAGAGRNLVLFDDAATTGLFSKRLIALLKTGMRRNAGGNSTSINKGKLTDGYLSPESIEDVRSWDLTQVDDVTRREIFKSDSDDGQGALKNIFGVNLHDIDELGVNQEYQNYFLNTLGGTLPGGKAEVLVGLDLSKDDSFVMPIRQEVKVYEDPSYFRQNRASMYGRGEHGFGCLDSRRVLLGAI